MSITHLETLQLVPERVSSAVTFLTSYAWSCLEEGFDTAGNAKDEPDSHFESLRNQRVWDLTVEAASSLVEAGQWAMLVSPREALALWAQAGMLYRQVDFGFGYYLSVIGDGFLHLEEDDTDGADRLDYAITRAVRAMVSASHLGNEKVHDRVVELPEPMLHPQQQAYLLLAGATRAPRRDSELDNVLFRMLRGSPHRLGVAPVGSLSIPISTIWQVADALINTSPSGIEFISDVLVGLSRRYQESVRLAMVNGYLWSNAAAPVDVGNFDIAALTVSATHAYQTDASTSIAERIETMRAGDALARSQLEIAVEVAAASPGSGEPMTVGYH